MCRWRGVLHRRWAAGDVVEERVRLCHGPILWWDTGQDGVERGVTATTVSKLCKEERLGEAVEALGIAVQTNCCIPKSVFHGVLKMCAVKKDVVLGRRVHAFTVEKGYESDTFLCNHIMRMYGSRCMLQEAMDVFTGVGNPDAFMWSSIISAHATHGDDKQALELYHRMRRSGVKPDGHVFVAALQACARRGELKIGQEMHADVEASGFERDLFVGNSLVDMYAKCGSLEDAQRVFDGLCEKDVVSWTAMIAGYSRKGMGQEALHLYSLMQEHGMAVPNAVTFVCLLQACACAGTPALEQGRRLHAEIRGRGLQGDGFVANSLVNMYAKCGSLKEAETLFERLGRKDVVTWTALITGYSQGGMGQKALRLYTLMQQEGVSVPNAVTFVCLLHACASVGISALRKGRQLHAQIREQGLESDMFVANSLVNMYAKCGSIEDGRKVFDGLGQKNVVTWSAMIAGYSQEGMGQEALHLYNIMCDEGFITPNALTFVCLLQACASVGVQALDKGKQLHAQIRGQRLLENVLVANGLINMYAKCGSLEDARSVFDRLTVKDALSWRAVIAGYSQQGLGQEALDLHRIMQAEGVAVQDAITFVCLLQACANVGWPSLDKGKQLHSEISGGGHHADILVANSLVNMYAKCGSLEDAQKVFDGLCERDVVTWSALIAGYAQRGMGQEALGLYDAMQQDGLVAPDPVTFASLLQACASVGTPALQKGRQIHVQLKERGHEADMVVATTLVHMYAKCGSLEEARRVFNGLGKKDVVTWNAMIAGYSQQGTGKESLRLYSAMQEEATAVPDCVTFVSLLQACAGVGTTALEQGKDLHVQVRERGYEAEMAVGNSLVNMYAKCGSLEDAQRLFDRLGHKDTVTWNAMIAAYSQQGMGQKALCLYRDMQEEGITVPDSITFVCLLQACANLAALHVGRQLHAQIEEQGLQADEVVACGVMNMYAKCGSMVDARQVFEALPESRRNAVTQNALIAGYSHQGDSEAVFNSISRMEEDGIQPDGITLLSVLTVCSHAGLVEKGQESFQDMSRHYRITPTVEHYTCMVDLLGRAGRLEEALALVGAMPVLPDMAVWSTLLGACQKWSNVEVGRHAFDQALKLDKNNAAAHVLMFNIYTRTHSWEQAHEIQVRRMRVRAWKQPGQSWWTDMDGMVHTFLVGVDKYNKTEAKFTPSLVLYNNRSSLTE